MVNFKFDNDFLDNLIEFEEQDNSKKEKFKEKDSLNYLISNRELLLIIPLIFKNKKLNIKKFKTMREWKNYIDNEFKNWVLKNKINKIKIKPGDKPDLIVTINDDKNNKIGIELTSVFPFIKSERGGDIFKQNEHKQTQIKNDFVNTLMKLNLKEKMPKIKIIENKIVFPKEFTNLNDKKIIEEAITQVKNIDKIIPLYFDPIYFKCTCDKLEHTETLVSYITIINLVSKNVENELDINNFESNLVSAISAKEGSLDIISRYEVKGKGGIKYYLNQVYLNIEKEKNNFVQTIIIYKNANFIGHIYNYIK